MCSISQLEYNSIGQLQFAIINLFVGINKYIYQISLIT